MTKESIPNELLNLLTEEEIIMFKELQIKIQELNYKTNLTRLIEGDDYWISQVYDSLWTFKENTNKIFDNKKFIDIGSGCGCLLYTSPSPRDATLPRMPSSA